MTCRYNKSNILRRILLRDSAHLLVTLHISVPHPYQSQFTPYNHNLHIYLSCYWPVDGCTTPVDASMGKSVFICIVTQDAFYDRKPRDIWRPELNFVGPEREILKPHKTGTNGVYRYDHKIGQISVQPVVKITRRLQCRSYLDAFQ